MSIELGEALGLAAGTLAEIGFVPNLLRPLNLGVLSYEDWQTTVVARLAELCGSVSLTVEVQQRWSAASRIDQAILDLLADAARHAPVVLVTNGTSITNAELTNLGVSDVLTAIVNSANIGIAKPARGIYEHAAMIAGVAVEGGNGELGTQGARTAHRSPPGTANTRVYWPSMGRHAGCSVMVS